jgi:PEP-CTERM motif
MSLEYQREIEIGTSSRCRRRSRVFLCALGVSMSVLSISPSIALAVETWEVVYDGVDSAADNVPNYLRWDSAVDDDWNQVGGSSFQLNSPSPGFMSVDRVTNPLDHGKTGNIWVRDPILSDAAGFTMEVGVKIKPNSNTDAFSMTYLDDKGSFGVHLSPNRIKAGGLGAATSGNTVAFNTTGGIRTYRIVKLPNSRSISVYVDGNPTPVVTGSGTTGNAVGSSPFLKYPRVLIGDNENNPSYNANYTLDFVRYRRGATAPGETPPAFAPRQLPDFPASAAPGGETWVTGYDGVGQPLSSGWIQGGGSVFIQQPDGIMELNGVGNARLDSVMGWNNQAGITLEARIKVLPDSDDGGFNLVANDQLGDTALVLSPGKVELMNAYSPVGKATIAMDTTDAFHIYRMTREANSLYWNLYIDNNPVATIANQHAGGNLLSFSRIWFGDINFPVPGNSPHVLIDYIRWYEGAQAPPLTTIIGDLNADGFVGIGDLNIILSNWNQNVPVGDWQQGDVAGIGDGFVGISDLNVVLANWNAGTPPPGLADAVPEPSTVCFVGLGAAAVLRRRADPPRRQVHRP